MRNTVITYDASFPIADDKRVMNDAFRIWVQQVTQRGLLIGTGSPEGVIEAQQGMEYMDETGLTGAVKFIKQSADIAGDRTMGWVAIG